MLSGRRRLRCAVMALVEARELFEGERREHGWNESIDRGQAWLLEHAKTTSDGANRTQADDYFGYALYNVWGHAFSIHAIARLHERASGDTQGFKPSCRRLLEYQVDRLRRDEFLNGGWGYYDEPFSDKYGQSIRATSTGADAAANGQSLLALRPPPRSLPSRRRRRWASSFPKPAVERAIASLHRQRYPDFAYAYGEYLRYSPRAGINQSRRQSGPLPGLQSGPAALRRSAR